MQKISSIINPENSTLCTVDSKLSVCEAVAHMTRLGVRSLLVVSEQGVVGVLTERDVIVGVVAPELDPSSVSVGQIVKSQLTTIQPNATLDEALELMICGCHQQLLVANDSEIFGLVSISEVTRSLVSDRDAVIGDLTYYITH